MSRVAPQAQVLSVDLYDVRTQAPGTHGLGEFVRLTDGRGARFFKAGGSAVGRAKLQLAPAPKANHQNRPVTAAVPVGASSVRITLAATAAVAGEYNGGFLIVNDVDGEGQTFEVYSHPAANASAGLTVKLENAVKVALTTSSEATLVHNAWNGTVEGTSATRDAAGVTLTAVGANQYGWVITRGITSCLIGAAGTLGSFLMADASTAGAVTDHTDVTAPQAQVIVGSVRHIAGVSTEYNPIVVCVD